MDHVPSRGTYFQPPRDSYHVFAIQTQFEGNLIEYNSKLFFRAIEAIAATICLLLFSTTIAFASFQSTYHYGDPVSLSWNSPGINLCCLTLFVMLDPDIFPPSHMCGSPTLYDSTRHYDLTLAPVMTHAHEIRPWSNAVAILSGVIIIECVKSVLFFHSVFRTTALEFYLHHPYFSYGNLALATYLYGLSYFPLLITYLWAAVFD